MAAAIIRPHHHPDRRYNHIRQVAPMCPPMWAHWRHLANMTEYDWTCVSFSPCESTTQTANRLVQAFLHSSRQCRWVHWCHLAITNEIVHTGAIWWIRLNSCFLRPTRVYNPNGKSISSAVSAQLTAYSPYTLQWATLFPKLALSWGFRPPSNSWFLGPFRDHNPNGTTIVLAPVTAECPYTLA